MSLFLGNLSPRIRQDELERVFRRFGRNNVRIKGGYGFVVYDLPENADKALGALRGKRICGEAIDLSWSKIQPRPVQRFTKGSKFYEPYHRRKFSRNEDYGMKKTDEDRLEFKMDTNHPVSESQTPYMRELHEEEKNYPVDQIGLCEGGNHNSKEGVLDETVAVESNPLDNDRWGEPVSNLLEDNTVEKGRKGTGFNRYEPYHGYNIIDEDENHQTSSHGSPALKNGEEKEWRGQQVYDATSKLPADVSNHQQVCYICGITGHKMSDCRFREASRRDNFTRLDGTDRGRHRHLTFRGRGERKLKRPRPASLGRPPSKGDLPSSRLHKSSRKTSGKSTTIDHGKNSSMEKETCKHQLKRDHKNMTSKGEQGIQERYRGQQISKGPSPSSSHSVSTASSSSLHSKPQGTNSCSRSRSISSQIRLVSSCLKSSPTSSYSRSESSKYIQPQKPKESLLSPLTKPTDESMSSPPTSLSRSIPLDQPLPSSPTKAQVEATLSSQKCYLDSNSETDILKGTSMTPEDEGMLRSYKVEDEMNKNQTYSQNKENRNDSTTRFHCICEVKSPCMNPSENFTTTAENLPAENSIERSNLGKSGQLTVQQIPGASRIKNSTSISSQEMCMVLKHYGFEVQEENEMHLTVEDHFGSARLWPWQIIYYRRLKKGPISTENYARRIDQNKEFGIVDKYIRSSSGWGEP